jgi:type IX secretion system PorP/SprF family membrane protein
MKTIIILVTIFIAGLSFAQMRMNTNLYMVNPALINPGYIDIKNETGIYASYARQYVRQINAPETMYLNAYHNLHRNHGVGVNVISDRYSNFNQLDISGNYMFSAWLGDETVLGLGVRAAYSQQVLNQNDFVYFDGIEPTLGGTLKTASFGVGTGLSLIARDFDFNLGLPFLFHNYVPDARSTNLVKNHIYSSMGYKFRINDDFILYPTTLLKVVSGAPISVSGDINLLINQMFWLGAGYKTANSASITAGIFLDNGLQVMYNFQTPSFSTLKPAGSSHEVLLGFTRPFQGLGFDKRKYISKSGHHRAKRW